MKYTGLILFVTLVGVVPISSNTPSNNCNYNITNPPYCYITNKPNGNGGTSQIPTNKPHRSMWCQSDIYVCFSKDFYNIAITIEKDMETIINDEDISVTAGTQVPFNLKRYGNGTYKITVKDGENILLVENIMID